MVVLPIETIAVPVSLVICISASPDFLTCISVTGASVVPTPNLVANTVDDVPTNVPLISPPNVDVSVTWKVLVVVRPATATF